jgi:hypothetical protein
MDDPRISMIGVACQLLDLCASYDDIPSCLSQILVSLRASFGDPRGSEAQRIFSARCVEIISDHVGAAELNEIDFSLYPAKNMMDFILSPGCACFMELKLDTIRKLVQRGGRISFPESHIHSQVRLFHGLYDIEAIELYFHQVRLCRLTE